MAYQPFLIAPFSTGLDTDNEPWMLPQDAFANIENGHIHHGVIEKREGFRKQGDFVYQDQTNWKVTGVSLASPCVITMTNVTGLTNGDVVEIRNITGTTELNGNQYTVANLAGGAGGTFELSGVDSTLFTAFIASGDVYKIPGTRVMGLERYIDRANVKEVIAFDEKRACKYDSTNGKYAPLDSADIMNGGEFDFISSDNWASTASSAAASLYRLYFTNGLALAAGLNGIRYYSGGSTTASFAPQINAPVGPIINGCKLLFAFQQRLVLLSTIEGANSYPQRARWCQAQGPSIVGAWDDNIAGKGGFVDAPTGDHIISAAFVQNMLIVFFTNSIWSLRSTPNPALPFRWDKINDFRSCDAKKGISGFDRYVLAVGTRGITATDGTETRKIDEKIDEFVINEINAEYFEKTFSKRNFASRKLWMLYANKADDPEKALIYDEESASFSKYSIQMNVLGYGGTAQDASITDFGDKTINEFGNDAIDDFFFDEASEIFIGGNRDGEIFEMDRGGDDNEISFSSTILDVSQADPAVVTMSGDLGLSDGDIVSISSIAAGSMVELNDREFIVESKSGNSFALQNEDSTGYAAYVAGSAGNIRSISSSAIDFLLDSAAWNPWITEGKQAQLGYVDLFVDTDENTILTVNFYTNNEQSPYESKTVNMLPNLVERGSIANITNASPGLVTSNEHGLVDGEEIYIYNVTGMSLVNGGPYTVTVVDSDNFTIGVDTTNFGIYLTGGVITELPFASGKAWKRVYAGGSGYQHIVRVSSSGIDKSLRIHAFMPWFKPRGVRPI